MDSMVSIVTIRPQLNPCKIEKKIYLIQQNWTPVEFCQLRIYIMIRPRSNPIQNHSVKKMVLDSTVHPHSTAVESYTANLH